MKFGCCIFSYQWETFPYGPKPGFVLEEVTRKVRQLGFSGVALLSSSSLEGVDEAFRGKRLREFKELLDSLGLEVAEFIAWNYRLLDRWKEVRGANLEHFRQCAQVAAELGTKVLNTPSHVPMPWDQPITKLFQLWRGSVFKVDVPSDFNWNKLWEDYVEVIGRCVDIASNNGLLYAMEGHPFCMISNTDAMLRLIDAVGSNSLGACYDSCHIVQVGEIPAVSVYKLGDRIFHCHISDNEGAIDSPPHATPGRGRIDWRALLRALKNVGYNGFLSIELIDMPSEMLDEEHVRAITFLREMAKKEGFEIE